MICRLRDESGQALLIAVGFTLIAFAVAGVAVDGARMFLLRRGLQSSVDAASMVAASQLDEDALYSTSERNSRLDPLAAMTEARVFVAQRGVADRLEVRVERDVVVLRATARLRTSFLGLVGVEELTVAADASAAPVFGEAP